MNGAAGWLAIATTAFTFATLIVAMYVYAAGRGRSLSQLEGGQLVESPPADLIGSLRDSVSDSERASLPGAKSMRSLSAKEAQVVHLLADGLTHSQIAAQLHLSTRTVRLLAARGVIKIERRLGVLPAGRSSSAKQRASRAHWKR